MKSHEQPYENIQLPTQWTTVFWSYTTALRYMLLKIQDIIINLNQGPLQPRQWTAKLHEWWITAVIAPRRWGKTYYLSTYYWGVHKRQTTRWQTSKSNLYWY